MSTPRRNYLSLTWSISRGRETYGYNIARLDSSATGARYRTCGGGYDMVGTVIGQWLESDYQDRLQALAVALREDLVDCGYSVKGYLGHPTKLYGLTVKPNGTVSLDGACGINAMIDVAEALGIELVWTGNRKGHTKGYFMIDHGSHDAMVAHNAALEV